MEGSSSAGWILDPTPTWSELLGKDVTLAENITDPHLPCEQVQEIYGQPLPIPIEIGNVVRYVQVVYYILNFMLGVFLNLFVIVLTLHFKRLQNVTFLLGLQVCVGDMINAAIVFSSSAASAFSGRFAFPGLCSILGFVIFFLSLARTYLMTVLVVDRFCTVLCHSGFNDSGLEWSCLCLLVPGC